MIGDARLVVGVATITLGAILVLGGGVSAQHSPGHAPPSPATGLGATPAAKVGPRRISEDELHRNSGVPRGWKFSLPSGDVARGRDLFGELECYKCHEIKTEKFPAPADGKYAGPELTGMGRIHPAEYIGESILFPNAVIVDEPGTTGPDGLSLMPSYADSLTLQQWLDLVAYLKGLTEGGEHPEGNGIERVATAGGYRIRLVYADGGHESHAGHRAGNATGGHLMAFITEKETGEAIPYLPVTATVQGPGSARRTVTLRPMVGDGGFHYGADVALPKQTRKVTLAIGPTTMRVTGAAKGRYSKPATAVFDWGAAAK